VRSFLMTYEPRMAEPLTADQFVQTLRAEGVHVIQYRSWRTNNRNHMGPWGPVRGVMIHHTVTSDVGQSVELCYEGRSDLPGPLCHGVISKKGLVYLVGNGRANHAGSGDGDVLQAVIEESPLPPNNEQDTDGNACFYGFECINLGDGQDPWPPEQVETIVRASAALCRAHGWGKDGDTSVIGHLEWSIDKIDPRGVSMNEIRRRVQERLRHSPDWNENDVALTDEDVERIADAVVRRKITVGEEELAFGTVALRAYKNALAAKDAALRIEDHLMGES